MPKYITLKAALHVLDLVMTDETIKHKGKAIRKRLNDLPTIEVKHGEWIEKEESLSQDYVTFAVCSVCGKGQSVSSAFPFESCVKLLYYCPNCGAKMDGKEGAEE